MTQKAKAESAALLVDDILPELPIRQWVVTFPHALRFLFATRPDVMSRVLGNKPSPQQATG